MYFFLCTPVLEFILTENTYNYGTYDILCQFQISDIKRIKPRLQSLLFKMTYSEVVDGIKPVKKNFFPMISESQSHECDLLVSFLKFVCVSVPLKGLNLLTNTDKTGKMHFK